MNLSRCNSVDSLLSMGSIISLPMGEDAFDILKSADASEEKKRPLENPEPLDPLQKRVSRSFSESSSTKKTCLPLPPKKKTEEEGIAEEAEALFEMGAGQTGIRHLKTIQDKGILLSVSKTLFVNLKEKNVKDVEILEAFLKEEAEIYIERFFDQEKSGGKKLDHTFPRISLLLQMTKLLNMKQFEVLLSKIPIPNLEEAKRVAQELNDVKAIEAYINLLVIGCHPVERQKILLSNPEAKLKNFLFLLRGMTKISLEKEEIQKSLYRLCESFLDSHGPIVLLDYQEIVFSTFKEIDMGTDLTHPSLSLLLAAFKKDVRENLEKIESYTSSAPRSFREILELEQKISSIVHEEIRGELFKKFGPQIISRKLAGFLNQGRSKNAAATLDWLFTFHSLVPMLKSGPLIEEKVNYFIEGRISRLIEEKKPIETFVEQVRSATEGKITQALRHRLIAACESIEKAKEKEKVLKAFDEMVQENVHPKWGTFESAEAIRQKLLEFDQTHEISKRVLK
jgi:hypothetical protein